MRKAFGFAVFAIALAGAGCSRAAPATPAPGELVVDPEVSLGPISPYVYGSNYGPWTAVPMGRMDLALDSHVTSLRWPGGEWGDINDIQTYQVDSFIEFCRQLDAEPTISVRLLNGTPEQAADLVRYVNIEKGYGVRFWSIGNEPHLYRFRPTVTYDTAQLNREWRAIALAMEAVDPDIQLIGPETGPVFEGMEADRGSVDGEGRGWMEEFLRANGDLVDIVSFHYYPFPRQNRTTTIDDLRRESAEWTGMVRSLQAMIRDIVGKDLPIAVTEANSHYNAAVSGQATPDSLASAVWWADVLGRLIREDVFLVNQFALTTSTGQAGSFGLIALPGPRPIYYVYQLFHRFGSERVYADSAAADVSILAARRADGALTLMVVNLAEAERTASLRIAGMNPDQAETWRLDREHNADLLENEPFLADGALTLPPLSVTLYVFR
jgi:hypothetical protein